MELEKDQEYFNIVIENMKRLLSVESDRQLAFALDILPASFANSKKRALIPCEKIIKVALKKNFNLNEIFGSNITEPGTSNTEIEEVKDTNVYDLLNLKVLDTKKDYIRVPFFTRNESDKNNYKAYLHDNKNIYVVNVEENNIEHGNFYLIKSNNVHYIRYITIDFDGSYTLKDEQKNSEKIQKDVLEKLEVIGKIEASFTKTISAN